MKIGMRKEKMKKLTSLFFALQVVFTLSLSYSAKAQNQDLQLAEEYFLQNDYEKAVEMYEKLARNNRNLPIIYKNYLSTLLALKEYKEAEKLIRRQIKEEPDRASYRIDYGMFWERQGNITKAETEYNLVINDFKKSPSQVPDAAEYFVGIDKPEFAEKMLLTARKAANDKTAYSSELADIYSLLNKTDAMIDEYLNFALADENNLEYVKSALQDQITKQEDFDKLENILLQRLQSNPNQVTYNELLLWLYLQQKRFFKAFIQAKALDKRYKLEGSELLNIGMIAMKNGDYKSAKTIFEHVVQTYPKSPNYPVARNYYIKAKEEVVKNTFPIQAGDIYSLIKDYENLIAEIGKNYKTFDAFRSTALLYAFYLDKKDTAVVILNEAIAISQGRTDFIAQCKSDLGDIYLLKNEPWEATLLYSQVEKLKKDHPVGYEAKLKNAKLSYFKGEFELSQEHLDILKEATSREIANDAMDLSLLIQDNLAFDTLGEALKAYSKIELLIFQHKDLEAYAELDKMLNKYTGHSITDEVLWSKANLLMKIGKPKEAIEILDKIVNEHGEDIMGDDAYFMIAKIYEENINDKEKAMEIYKNLLTKYPGSIYIAEARKRFRILRGDFVN